MGGPEGWQGTLVWSGVGAQKSPAGEAGPEGRLGRWALADLLDGEQGVGEVAGVGHGTDLEGGGEDGGDVGGVGRGGGELAGVDDLDVGADGAQAVRRVEAVGADVDAGPRADGVATAVGGDGERDVVDAAFADVDAARDALSGGELDDGADLVDQQGVLGGGDEGADVGRQVGLEHDDGGGFLEAVLVAVGDEQLASGVVRLERVVATLESGVVSGRQGRDDSGTGLVPLAEGFSGVERGEGRRGLVVRLLEHGDGRGEDLADGGLAEGEHDVGVEGVEDGGGGVHGIWYGLVVGIARGDKVE